MKEYGIKVSIPDESTMSMEHLLGKSWEAYRWFDSLEQRDHIYKEMQRQPENYRKGDTIQQILEKVERG